MFLGIIIYAGYLHFYKIKELNNEIEILRSANTDILFNSAKDSQKAKFLDDYVVIIPKGSKYFYEYDDYVFGDNDTFYITTYNGAISSGYIKGEYSSPFTRDVLKIK